MFPVLLTVYLMKEKGQPSYRYVHMYVYVNERSDCKCLALLLCMHVHLYTHTYTHTYTQSTLEYYGCSCCNNSQTFSLRIATKLIDGFLSLSLRVR